MWIGLPDAEGVIRAIPLGPAYVSDTVTETLVSGSMAQKYGVGVRLEPFGKQTMYDDLGFEYPLKFHGDTPKMEFYVVPCDQSKDLERGSDIGTMVRGFSSHRATVTGTEEARLEGVAYSCFYGGKYVRNSGCNVRRVHGRYMTKIVGRSGRSMKFGFKYWKKRVPNRRDYLLVDGMVKDLIASLVGVLVPGGIYNSTAETLKDLEIHISHEPKLHQSLRACAGFNDETEAGRETEGMAQLTKAYYMHKNGSEEEVEIKKYHADSDAYTVFVPSLGRERQTTEERLRPLINTGVDGPKRAEEKVRGVVEKLDVEEQRRLQKITKRKAAVRIMRQKHVEWNHMGLSRLNSQFAAGKIPGGCWMKDSSELKCPCYAGKQNAPNRSSKRRRVPKKVLSYWQVDIYSPPEECSPNRSGYKYILGFICRATGWVFLYFMKTKSSPEIRRGFLALDREIARISPWVEERHGYAPKIAEMGMDVDGGFTTTNGQTGNMVDAEFVAKNRARKFTGAGTPHKNGKIEALWESMSKGTSASLFHSGMRPYWYYDAVSCWEFAYNALPSAANLWGAVAPNETLGLPDKFAR